MKLISKTIFYYLLISLPLLALAGLFSFYLIKTELRDGTDEALWKEKLGAERMIKRFSITKPLFLSADSLSCISPSELKGGKPFYHDTVVYDRYEEEHLNYRILSSDFSNEGQAYTISIAKATYEEDGLMESLFSAFALIIGFLVVAFFIVNWLLSKVLWKPFYKTVEKLNSYDIKKHEAASFSSVNTKEFDQLNHALNKMIEKIHLDFSQQKEFTENASHEMQTPLAVIKANLNLLMQSPNMKAEEMSQMQSIDNTTKKLASLNKALLLLAKIENNQFREHSTVLLRPLVQKTVTNYEDLLEVKKISIENKFNTNLQIQMNPVLADVLLTNLFQNAIRHNYEGGKVIIENTIDTLVMSNTGESLKVIPAELFVRFKKNDASKDSLGLGLAIVKSILDVYGFTIEYSFLNDLHKFTIKFN